MLLLKKENKQEAEPSLVSSYFLMRTRLFIKLFHPWTMPKSACFDFMLLQYTHQNNTENSTKTHQIIQ